jgi:hypothetical protein
MGGSTDQVARYKLGAALAEAAPYLLAAVGDAPPRQDRSVHALMQLLDRDSFPDESSVSRDRVRPFVSEPRSAPPSTPKGSRSSSRV